MRRLKSAIFLPELPDSINLGDQEIFIYAISHPVNCLVHNGRVFFEAHKEILAKLSCVCADIFAADQECCEIPMPEMSDQAMNYIQTIIYAEDFRELMTGIQRDLDMAEAIFLLIVKYGFQENDFEYFLTSFIDSYEQNPESLRIAQEWFLRFMDIPLIKCADSLIDGIIHHDDFTFQDEFLEIIDNLDIAFLEHFCDRELQKNYYRVRGLNNLILFTYVWWKTLKAEYLMLVLTDIHRMKERMKIGMNFFNSYSNGVTEEEANQLNLYKAELVSALNWTEVYVETKEGHCQLEIDRVEEIRPLLERTKDEVLKNMPGSTVMIEYVEIRMVEVFVFKLQDFEVV